MSTNWTDICQSQYGQAIASEYLVNAINLAEMCLLPNWGIDQSILENVETIAKIERTVGNDAYGPGYISDIKIFAKPDLTTLAKDHIDPKNIEALFNWSKSLYPEPMQYYDLDPYWTVLDIFHHSRSLTKAQLAEWLNSLFLNSQYYDKTENQDLLNQRNQCLKLLSEFLVKSLFNRDQDQISLYCLTDAGNENTAATPYIIVSNNYIVVFFKEWIL